MYSKTGSRTGELAAAETAAEEIRKSGGGAVKRSDDRKPSAAAMAVSASDGGPAKKVVLKSADMKEEMQKEAIDCAIAAFERHGVEKEVAEYIKKEFDRSYGPTWHCIVGRNFGSYVTHETNHFIYFYLDSKAILLFKSG
ncbi:dynein light chain 1, cytoplasmic [Iris pallida]|uniref:Dynein light chain n=1 Tax=Iris pallida TaxID=29817 RepID=A0AAX6FQT7_IRIPA|nr:dynein light chain 1, cytoplasmic [Iris pallida]